MFDNPGKKLKLLAKILFEIEFFVSIIAAIVMFGMSIGSHYDDEASLLGKLGLVFLVMPIFLYVANLLIYTFGIFVEKIINIESEISDVKLFLSKDSPKDLSQIKKENEYVESVDKMENEGIISKDEYETIEKSKNKISSERLAKLATLYEKGLINAEEYKKALLEETNNDEDKE